MGRKKRLVSSTLVRVIIVFASVIACTPDSRGTGSPAALEVTVFGRFDPPSGSVFIGDSSSPHSGQFGTNCPSYTRIFGTTDLVSFEQAVDATAQKAQWSDAQSQTAELPPHARALAPLDGVSALFIGQHEEMQLSFWSSAENVQSETRFYDYSKRIRQAGFDWNAYPVAVVLEILDRSRGGYCTDDDLGGVTRISGRVTDQATGLPLAAVSVSTAPNIASLARTGADGRYVHQVRRWYGENQYTFRIRFDAGPGYKAVFWADAPTIDAASEITVGRYRNLEYTAIDAAMQKSDVP